jgi:hypothetical protein
VKNAHNMVRRAAVLPMKAVGKKKKKKCRKELQA